MGYDRQPKQYVNVDFLEFVVGFFDYVPGQPTPDFDGEFSEFAVPPNPRFVAQNVPFEPDSAIRVGISVGPGLQDRGGTGFVRFAPETTNLLTPIAGFEGDHSLEPPRDQPLTRAPAILDFYFESDTEGVGFVGSSLLGPDGVSFDETLGDHGGYRIPIAVDGMGDEEQGDIDAILTYILLVGPGESVPDPEDLNVYQTQTGGTRFDHSAVIYDSRALGITISGDFNKDGTVDGDDFLIWQQFFGQTSGATNNTGDADGDGDVDGNDFLIWQAAFGNSDGGNRLPSVPEPGTAMLLAAGLVAVLVRGRTAATLGTTKYTKYTKRSILASDETELRFIPSATALGWRRRLRC